MPGEAREMCRSRLWNTLVFISKTVGSHVRGILGLYFEKITVTVVQKIN